VYGLAAFASNERAVRRLFELKQRPMERSIAVLVADRRSASELVQLTPQAERLAKHFWPGPLTIVAARLPAAPAHLGTPDTLGVRVPDEEIVRLIAEAGPLAVTSANLHGGATPTTARGVSELFEDVQLVIDSGKRPGASSTVVDVTAAEPVILRAGPVSLEQILAVSHHRANASRSVPVK